MTIAGIVMAVVLFGGGAVYLGLCLVAMAGLARREGMAGTATPTVSIIIPARNEEQALPLLLMDLSMQDYPADRVEILVADDSSSDGTAARVREAATVDPRIRLVDVASVPSIYTHKKRAVHTGIVESHGEVVVTVDADCRVGRLWLGHLVGALTPGRDLVAGIVTVHGGGLLGGIEALELGAIEAAAAGLMNAGFPITCNGADLAYRREAFDRVGGFADVGHIVSGDDDLLMQKIARGDTGRVWFVTDHAASVRTQAVDTVRGYLSRRVRWVSKIPRYPSRSAFLALLAAFVYILGLVAALPLAATGVIGWNMALAGFGIKAAGDFLMAFRGAWLMGRPWLCGLFPLAELLHIPYIIGVTIGGCFGSFEWHGRRSRAVTPE